MPRKAIVLHTIEPLLLLRCICYPRATLIQNFHRNRSKNAPLPEFNDFGVVYQLCNIYAKLKIYSI